MKWLLGVVLLLAGTSVGAQPVEVQLTDTQSNEVARFRLGTDSASPVPIQSISGRELPSTTVYGIRQSKLFKYGIDITDAVEVLYQCHTIGGDVVVVRRQNNSFSSPAKVASAVAGHPVPVSEVVALRIEDFQIKASWLLRKKQWSEHWNAKVFQ